MVFFLCILAFFQVYHKSYKPLENGKWLLIILKISYIINDTNDSLKVSKKKERTNI